MAARGAVAFCKVRVRCTDLSSFPFSESIALADVEHCGRQNGRVLKIVKPTVPRYIPLYRQTRDPFCWWIHHWKLGEVRTLPPWTTVSGVRDPRRSTDQSGARVSRPPARPNSRDSPG